MKKPPPTPPKGGESLLDEYLQYSPYLSSPERMGLSPFRGSWRGLEVGGRLPFVTALHVTRYIFAYGVFVWRQGGYSLLLYIIYILYIIIILFIF